MAAQAHFFKIPVFLTAAALLGGCQNSLVRNSEPAQPHPQAAPTQDRAPHPGRAPAVIEPRNPVSDSRQIALTGKALEKESASLEHSQGERPLSKVPTAARMMQDTPSPLAPPQDLWELTRNNLGLDLSLDNPRIQAQLRWYRKHPKYLDRVARRAEPYYYYIINEVLERGMPAEFALLPVVESAYDPFAYSHGRAAGPWQFIPGTADHFGLARNWWYEGRRDIRASTQAALDYLQQLHAMFDGDWLLALASYNAGQGNVLRAVKRNRRLGKPTDFWNLRLPRETSAYVPKLLALGKLVQDPSRYGLRLHPLANRPQFAVVDVGSQIDLAKAAELAGISVETLYQLNPAFNRWATPPQGPHELLVPLDRAKHLRQRLKSYPASQRLAWQRYRIRPGDSLSTIAARHNLTSQALRQANRLRGSLIRAGDTLMIPVASSQAPTYALSKSQRQRRKNQRLASDDKRRIDHEVRPGDSFWKIARAHDVGVRQLAAWNQMAPGDTLGVGQELVIWQPRSTGASTTANPATAADRVQDSREVVRRVGYRVRSGDSLYRIANRFRVRIRDIKRWNEELADARYLQPGQQLTLYVDVTNGRH